MHGRHTSAQQRSNEPDHTDSNRPRGRRRRHRAMAAWALVTAAALAACSDDGSSGGATSPTPASTTPTATTPAPSAPATSAPATSAPATAAPTTSAAPPVTSAAPIASVEDFFDAVASTASDIGPGLDFVVDQVAQGRYDAGYRRRQDSIDACAGIERPLLHGATYEESVDGRGWLYVDLDSPQRPYVAHSVMVLADESAAQQVMADLRAAADLPTCVAEWVAAVNREDAGTKNPAWSSASIEHTAVDAAFAASLDGLGEDQLSVTWQQRMSIDGVETPPEEMTFSMARFGAALFTFSGNDPDRTATAAAVLAARVASSIDAAMVVFASASGGESFDTVEAQRQAEAALLRPEDLGEGWQDLGPANAFPMTAALATSLPSCAPFVDRVFEGNDGVWAHRAFGVNADVAFTSVTVFATEADAVAMVAATMEPAFDECWAGFNEIAGPELAFGVESADYASVDPPDIELGGDSSSLHALEGTVTFGSTTIPDTCVCAFVQQGRTVLTFHAAAHVFTAAQRQELILAAIVRIDDEIE